METERGLHRNTASCTEQQQIPDLVSSFFGHGVDVVKESIGVFKRS